MLLLTALSQPSSTSAADAPGCSPDSNQATPTTGCLQLQDLPDDALLELLHRMDAQTHAAWRLTCRRSAALVYQAARTLTWSPALYHLHHLHHLPWPSSEPTVSVVAKCPLLRKLHMGWTSIHLPALTDISCLPASLQQLHIAGPHCITDWAPLARCTALRDLYVMLPKSPVHTSPHQPLPLTLAAASASATTELAAVSNPHYQSLLGALAHLTNLTAVSVTCGAMTATDAGRLATMLPSLSLLRRLSLCNIRLGAPGLSALSASLQSLTGLQVLDLRGCDVGAIGADVLAGSVLPRLPRLQVLLLCRNGLDADGASAVLQAASEFLTELQEIELTSNRLYAENCFLLREKFAELFARVIVQL